jgi:hypothetical protein
MSVTVSPTQSNIQTALRSFLVSILPANVPVIEGEDNRVAEPSATDFVVMTVIRRERISTNVDSYDQTILDPTTLSILQATKLTIQLDVHGPASSDNSQIISTLFRDDFAVQAFAQSGFDISPLYADDPMQIGFVNAENQWEIRYVVQAFIQANQVVVVQQDFADEVNVGLVSVDATYPAS